MSASQVYTRLKSAKSEGNKQFVVLVDPDDFDPDQLELLVKNAVDAKVDYFFLGGSLVINNRISLAAKIFKENSDIPVVLFPGDTYQLNESADALLFLSLISGRNPELLIGKHVIAAPYLKKSNLEIISTGYMLIDGGRPTTVSYMSNSLPIPYDKPEIALCTAQAGEMLGMKLIYMDAGSGAKRAISSEMIAQVSNGIDIPLITGGGIRTPEAAFAAARSGADAIVIGHAIEKDNSLLTEMAAAVHAAKATPKIIHSSR